MRRLFDAVCKGMKLVNGIEFPIFDQLELEKLPNREPTWIIIYGLCNGIPEKAEEFDTFKEALKVWGHGDFVNGFIKEDLKRLGHIGENE